MFAAMTATSCEDSNTDKTLDPEAPEFNITTATPTGGSIAVSMDDAVVSKAKQGSVVTIKATADEGYRFTGWVLSGDTTPFIASAPQTTFRMPAEDIEVSATFEELPKSFAVNFTASSTGGAVIVTIANEPIASGDVVLVGTDVTITARPAANYYFSGWSGVTLNDNTARTATFKMPASAVTISAAFTETPVTAFALNYTATYPGGTVSVKVGNSNLSNGGTVDVNADVTITASPANGYRFTEWGGVTLTDKTAATATFKMPASNVTLSAIFTAIPTYNLTAPASVTGNGRVEVRVDDYPITGTRAVYAGQTIRVISIPDGNWTLKGLTITGISTYDPTSRNIEFAMPANAVTISNVVFEVAAQYYPVNVKAPTGGRIDVSVGGSVLTTAQLAQVQVGSSVTFTAVPADAEYTFKTWNNISGITIANLTASTHTFTMPANAVSIGAEFLQKTYTLALTAPTNGSVVLKVGGSTVTSGSAFPKGTVVTMEATPASGHDFKEWTVSSSPAVTISPNATTSPATFTMQASNATITATFILDDSVPMTYVEIAGVKWATNNLDSPGKFTTSRNQPGMYYQWGINVAHYLSNPDDYNTRASIPEGQPFYSHTEYWGTNSNVPAAWPGEDPCPKGWRLPLQGGSAAVPQEFTALFNATTASKDGNLMWFTDKTDPSKEICFPISGGFGYRTGRFTNTLTDGSSIYWSGEKRPGAYWTVRGFSPDKAFWEERGGWMLSNAVRYISYPSEGGNIRCVKIK